MCNTESVVYRDRLQAEREARHLRHKYHSPDIRVYELTSPGVLYVLSEEDVFEVGRQKRIGKRKLRDKMDTIRKGIENGFYDWYDVVETAVDAALNE